jgi:hypothetical protein
MTEAEWLACCDPELMVQFVSGRTSERKLWLFATACCRRIWDELTDQRSRDAVEFAERYVDTGRTDEQLRLSMSVHDLDDPNGEQLSALQGAAEQALFDAEDENESAAEAAYMAIGGPYLDAVSCAADVAAERAAGLDFQSPKWQAARRAEMQEQCRLLRDILGGPFHPVTVSPAWLAWNDGTVAKLAAAVYDERAFDRLPILAHALEEAGCDEQAILDHLRGPGPHVLGCWALDLVLEKE